MKAHTPSIEERMNTAHRRFVLVDMAARGVLELQDDEESVSEILDAIAELVRDTDALLEPIRHAPAAVANWNPSKGAA